MYAHKKSKALEGEVVEILERARETFVGTVEIAGRFAFLTPDSRQMPFDLFIPLDKLNGAATGRKPLPDSPNGPKMQKIPLVKLLRYWETRERMKPKCMPSWRNSVFLINSPKRWKKKQPASVTGLRQTDYKSRRDFRDIPTFTIDPEDAKDFDDALSLRHLPDGNWEIGVHIADVTHYVKPDTLIDEEGLQRATSVYLVDRVVPMLPERLSNFICSLRPNEEKLCFSAVFEMNDQAEVLDEWFGRTIIKSDRRFTYGEAQKIIDTGEGDLSDEILKLNELAILRKRRFKAWSHCF